MYLNDSKCQESTTSYRILIGGQFNTRRLRAGCIISQAGENVGWKVMRKVNKVGKLDFFLTMQE